MRTCGLLIPEWIPKSKVLRAAEEGDLIGEPLGALVLLIAVTIVVLFGSVWLMRVMS